MDPVTVTLPEAGTAPAEPLPNLVEVEDLKVHFPIRAGIFQTQVGTVKAVDGISFDVRKGETLGLVGESGCGKSTTGRAMIRLREPTEGAVRFDGIDLAGLKSEELRRMRRRMQIIFQDPYGSLDPRMTVGSIIGEPIDTHKLAKGAARKERVADLLRIVGLDPKYVSTATRTSSAVGSASASASRGRSRSSPSSSSATSPSRRSTCPSRRRSSTC